MTTTPKCHWNSDLGWLTPEHRADCKDECKGCRPCAKTHCALFGRCANHVDVEAGIVTCPGCIGRVRGNLRAIEERMGELDEEVEAKGVESEALNLAGPANIGVPLVPAPYDRHHPLLVLGRWDMMIREDYDHPTSLMLTISRARDYLDSQLVRIANDDGQDFELLATEVAACLTHLESVLGDSRTPEQGVACPSCREADDDAPPRLVKHYGSVEKDDVYRCPRNGSHWWSEADYRLRVGALYITKAPALNASDMHQAHAIKPGSLTGWATAGKVRKLGKDQNGRQLYSVADAKGMANHNLDSQSA